jgi:hypothetical protein
MYTKDKEQMRNALSQGLQKVKVETKFHIENSMLEEIHSIFMMTYNTKSNCFLCGGSSSSGGIRDKVRAMLLRKSGDNLRIFYPEDLFMEVMNRKKDADLLSLESILANQSHLIFVICESIGSAAELGAFANNIETRKKMVVIVNKKYKRQNSFIMTGPVKLIKKEHKEWVVFYDVNNLDKLIDDLSKIVKSQRKMIIKKHSSLDITDLSRFFMVILYFFRSMSEREMFDCVVDFLKTKYDAQDFSTIERPSLKLLFSEGIIMKSGENYALTKKGAVSAYSTIMKDMNSEQIKLCDKIRFDILEKELSRSS